VIWLLIGAGVLALSVGLSVLIGKGIRIADDNRPRF
jgi:hypothetical protein